MISWYCKQVVIWHACTDCTQHVKKKFPLIVMWNVCICGDYLWTHCTCIQMCFLLCLILLAILECLGNSRNICSVLSSVMRILFDVLSYFVSFYFTLFPTTYLYICWKQIYAKTILVSFAQHYFIYSFAKTCSNF